MFSLQETLKSHSGRSLTEDTNFAMESIEQTFSGQADFGRRVTRTISRNGDLAYRTYLQVTLPEIDQGMKNSTGAVYARWLDFPGHQLIAQVEVEIGGQRIDRQYGDWMRTSGANLPEHQNNQRVTTKWLDKPHNLHTSQTLTSLMLTDLAPPLLDLLKYAPPETLFLKPHFTFLFNSGTEKPWSCSSSYCSSIPRSQDQP